MNSSMDHFGAGGGGFVDSSPSDSQVGKKVYKAQNCVPVSIRQILQSTEDNFKIGQNTDVHLVTIVGLLTNKESDSTKASFIFDDYTGNICAYVFSYNDSDSGVSTDKSYEIGQYYRVFGSVRMTDGKHHIMAFKVEPLESLDELTMHLLEVVYVPLSIDEIDIEEQSTGSAGSFVPGPTNVPHFNNSMSNVGSTSITNSGLNSQQQMIYDLIRSSVHGDGLDVNTITADKISPRDLAETLDFLTGEGHIYSTLDDHHYKSTDM